MFVTIGCIADLFINFGNLVNGLFCILCKYACKGMKAIHSNYFESLNAFVRSFVRAIFPFVCSFIL